MIVIQDVGVRLPTSKEYILVTIVIEVNNRNTSSVGIVIIITIIDGLESLNVMWVIGLLVVAVVFALLAWWRFERRDIRVGGEGGWQRPTRSALFRLLPRRFAPMREVAAPERVSVQR